jgi:hypothetical protein
MRVQPGVGADPDAESWRVLGDDQVPVEPVERWLS